MQRKRKEREVVIGKQDVMGRLFVAPPVILFLMFTLIPMIMAIGMSFTKYDVINPPTFAGLENFRKLLRDEFFRTAMKNTCVYTLLYVPLGLGSGAVFECGTKVCRSIPDAVLFACSFFYSGYCYIVVLDSESSDGTVKRDLKDLWHS